MTATVSLITRGGTIGTMTGGPRVAVVTATIGAEEDVLVLVTTARATDTNVIGH